MKTYYNIYIDNNKIGKSESYDEALGYIKENYAHILPYLEWEPRGAGGVDRWDNGINSIMIEKYYPDGVDLEYLVVLHNKNLEKHKNIEESEREIIDQEEKKKMPFTPRRTTLKMKKKKKTTVMKVGEIKEGEDGKMYICKERANGKLYWARYVQKTYQGAPAKKKERKERMCPGKPAKDYAVGSVKKGLDGKMWIVKEMNNGNLRWARK